MFAWASARTRTAMLLSSTSEHVNSALLLAGPLAVECPAVRPIPGAVPAVMEIPHFATSEVVEFRAVDVACDEVYKKGAPLLALLPLGTCLSALCTGGCFDGGWWLFKIQWLT